MITRLLRWWRARLRRRVDVQDRPAGGYFWALTGRLDPIWDARSGHERPSFVLSVLQAAEARWDRWGRLERDATWINPERGGPLSILDFDRNEYLAWLESELGEEI